MISIPIHVYLYYGKGLSRDVMITITIISKSRTSNNSSNDSSDESSIVLLVRVVIGIVAI